MKLLLMRHAIAVEREAFEGDDGKRPLTREGIGRMRTWLSRVVNRS